MSKSFRLKITVGLVCILVVSGCATIPMNAVKNNDVVAVKTAIAKGADVNAKDKDGTTVLILAAQKGHTEIASALIEADADVNAKDKEGKTALMSAAKYGHTEIASVLIKAGADVNAEDNFGSPVLLYFLDGGLIEMTELLMSNGLKIHKVVPKLMIALKSDRKLNIRKDFVHTLGELRDKRAGKLLIEIAETENKEKSSKIIYHWGMFSSPYPDATNKPYEYTTIETCVVPTDSSLRIEAIKAIGKIKYKKAEQPLKKLLGKYKKTLQNRAKGNESDGAAFERTWMRVFGQPSGIPGANSDEMISSADLKKIIDSIENTLKKVKKAE